MRKMLITQRLGYNEDKVYFDSLEHNYIEYFTDRDFYVSIVPNTVATTLKQRMKDTELIVLSGGGLPFSKDKRQTVEKYLIEEGLKKGIPILGICRGMQAINAYFGGEVVKVEKHTTNHEIMITELLKPKVSEGIVNSYHEWGVNPETLASSLMFFALAEDGVVEGIYHPNEKIIGVQWHPERKSKDGIYYSKWVDDVVFDYLFEK